MMRDAKTKLAPALPVNSAAAYSVRCAIADVLGIMALTIIWVTMWIVTP